jgi:hypothetical protein
MVLKGWSVGPLHPFSYCHDATSSPVTLSQGSGALIGRMFEGVTHGLF